MTSPTPHGPRICHAAKLLPLPMLRSAMHMDRSGQSDLQDVEEVAACALQGHSSATAHYGFVMDLPGPRAGAVWAVWNGSRGAPALIARPNCPATSATGMDACGLFVAHQGLHTWELYDMQLALARARLEALPQINHPFE